MRSWEGHNWSADDPQCPCESCVCRRTQLHTDVAAGAALLDELAPGWWERIDVASIDFAPWAAPAKHIVMLALAPTTSDFINQYDAMHVILGWDETCDLHAWKHGFIPRMMVSHEEHTKAWVNLILKRYIEMAC